MRYTIYKDGEFVNRIVADEAFVQQAFPAAEGYTHELIPESEPGPPEPTEEEDIEGMLIDHEYRLTLLELGV